MLGLEGQVECGLADIRELDGGERSSRGTWQTVCSGETGKAGTDRFGSASPKRRERNVLGAGLGAGGQLEVSGGPYAVGILSGQGARSRPCLYRAAATAQGRQERAPEGRVQRAGGTRPSQGRWPLGTGHGGERPC